MADHFLRQQLSETTISDSWLVFFILLGRATRNRRFFAVSVHFMEVQFTPPMAGYDSEQRRDFKEVTPVTEGVPTERTRKWVPRARKREFGLA